MDFQYSESFGPEAPALSRAIAPPSVLRNTFNTLSENQYRYGSDHRTKKFGIRNVFEKFYIRPENHICQRISGPVNHIIQ